GGGPDDSLLASSYVDSMVARVTEWPMHTLTVLGFILIVWLGAWAARRHLLEQPERHLPALRFAAGAGLGIAALGGLPMGLLSAGLLHADTGTAGWMKLLYETSGAFGG